MIARILFVLLQVLACGFACGQPAPNTPPSPAPAPPSPPNSVTSNADRPHAAEAINAFAADLWRQLRTADGNLVVSPASISLALCMAYGGANGETAEQMRRVLHLGMTADRVHAANADLLASWNAPGKPYDMFVANRVFSDRQFPILDGYVALTRDRYGAPLEMLDMRGSPDTSAQRINAWVSEQTRGRIRDIVRAELLRAGRAVLVNAIYFKGKWVTPFAPGATRDQDFTLASGQRVRAPMMHTAQHFGYAAIDDGAKVLRMRYEGNDIEMIVALPRDPGGLAALEQQVTATRVDQWVRAMSETDVVVALPRFRIEMASPLLLSTTLQAMGMRLAFSDGADFSTMSTADALKIGEVVHRVFVEVNEEGTEAAAATGVVMTPGSAVPPEPIRFIADHPFLFFIRDVRSGAILFWGRVANPVLT